VGYRSLTFYLIFRKNLIQRNCLFNCPIAFSTDILVDECIKLNCFYCGKITIISRRWHKQRYAKSSNKKVSSGNNTPLSAFAVWYNSDLWNKSCIMERTRLTTMYVDNSHMRTLRKKCSIRVQLETAFLQIIVQIGTEIICNKWV